MTEFSIRKGEIYRIDWSPGRGSEQTGNRPTVGVQSDAGKSNPNYTNTIVVAISKSGRPAPFHVRVESTVKNKLSISPSFIKCEQLMTISKERLTDYIGDLDLGDMQRVDRALKKVMDLA